MTYGVFDCKRKMQYLRLFLKKNSDKKNRVDKKVATKMIPCSR